MKFPDCTIHHCDQRTPEWYALRNGVLTASRVGPWLLGNTKRDLKARRSAIFELLSQIGDCYEPPTFETEAMRRGIDLEDEAVHAFEQATGLVTTPVGFCKAKAGSFGCSPDGLLMDEGEGFEGKCPSGKKHFEYLFGNELPAEYYWQVHHSLAVTGAKAWWFQSYHPGQPALRMRVEPNDDTKQLRDALIEFDKELTESLDMVSALWDSQLGEEAA